MITLVPVGAGTGARAQLHWEVGQGGRLVVSGLAQPPPGRSYQMWLGSIKLGNRASGGLLMVDAQGEGTLRIAPPRATWSPDIFAVTVERQEGAREPSDELVLVGELTRRAGAREGAGRARHGPDAAPGEGRARAGRRAIHPRLAGDETTDVPHPCHAGPPGARRQRAGTGRASLPPSGPASGSGAPLVRVVPVPVERAWTVTQSVLRSLGWDIERTERSEGLIRTEPRNVDFKNVGVYATGTRHALDLVVRSVSEARRRSR